MRGIRTHGPHHDWGHTLLLHVMVHGAGYGGGAVGRERPAIIQSDKVERKKIKI